MASGAQEEYDVREVIKAVAKEKCPDGYKIKLDDKEIDRIWESVEVQVGPIQYGPIPPLNRTPVIKVEEKFQNGISEKQKMKFSKSATTTATLTWSVNAGVKLGAKAAVSTGLPYIAEGKVDVKPEISLGIARAQTKTTTQTWTKDVVITVPPRTCVTADLCITEASYETDFTVDVAVSASYTFSFNAKFDYWSVIRAAFITAGSGPVVVGGDNVGVGGRVGAVIGGVVGGVVGGVGGSIVGVVGGPVGVVGVGAAGVGAGGAAGGPVGAVVGGFFDDIVGGINNRPKTKNVSFTAEDVFERLPGFRKDEKKGLVYCQVRGRFKGVHGLGVEVITNQEDL